MYVKIMATAINAKLKKGEKPDLSIKDWKFIYDALECLIDIYNTSEEFPEYFQMEVLDMIENLDIRRGGDS